MAEHFRHSVSAPAFGLNLKVNPEPAPRTQVEAALITTADSPTAQGALKIRPRTLRARCHRSLREADRTLTSLAVKEEEARRQRTQDALDAEGW